MFRRPEECLMALLAILWLGAHYWLAALLTSASVFYTFFITGLVALWTIVLFWLWHKDWIYPILPAGVGLWLGCWIPILSFWANGEITWYNNIWFKVLVVSVPIVLGYLKRYQHQHKHLV